MNVPMNEVFLVKDANGRMAEAWEHPSGMYFFKTNGKWKRELSSDRIRRIYREQREGCPKEIGPAAREWRNARKVRSIAAQPDPHPVRRAPVESPMQRRLSHLTRVVSAPAPKLAPPAKPIEVPKEPEPVKANGETAPETLFSEAAVPSAEEQAKAEWRASSRRFNAASRGLSRSGADRKQLSDIAKVTRRSNDWSSKVLHDVSAVRNEDGRCIARLDALADFIESLPLLDLRRTGVKFLGYVDGQCEATHFMVRCGGRGLGCILPDAKYALTGYGAICWGWGAVQGMSSVVRTNKDSAELQRVFDAQPIIDKEVEGWKGIVHPQHVAAALRLWTKGSDPVVAYRAVRDNPQLSGDIVFEEVRKPPVVVRTAPKAQPKTTAERLEEAKAAVAKAKADLAGAESRVAELELVLAEEERQSKEDARKARLIELLTSGMGIEEAMAAL